MRTRKMGILGAIFFLIFLTNSTKASVLWDGNAANGTGVFKVLNVEPVGSTLTVETDAAYGSVWKFYKPGTSPRCEVHAAQGFQAAQNDVFYLGWRCKLNMATNTKTYAIFQWKSYPTDVVNHPVMLRTLDGNFVLEQYNPDGSGGRTKTVLWSAPVVTDTWVSFVVNIKASTTNTGYIQFWYNGVQQTFTTGSNKFTCTTLTSDYCDPKWGVYNDVADNTTVTNYVSGLKIASTYSEAAPVMYAAPDAPGSLAATAVSSSQINLTWADNSDNETAFRIQRSPDNVTFSTVTTVGANVTSYSDAGLSPLTTYYYRVRAENAYGNSSYSARANATTSGNLPAAPSSLSATAISTSQINLSWADNSDNEDNFAIERSLNGSTWSSLTSVGANTTSYSNTGLTSGTTYYYRVRAVNTSGNSSYTSVASATTSSGSTLTNVALNKTATASSTWSSSYPAAYAVDGNTSTRWASASGVTSATLEIDLGGTYNISQTIISEYNSRVSSYKIQYWTGSAWADAYTGTTIGASKTDNFTARTTTKVRLNILNCSVTAPSIYEFEVYGTAVSNVALNKTATASSTWSSSYPASYAVDGSGTTRWASASGVTAATLEIDLGGSYSISKTVTSEYSSRVSSYKIQYWTGSAWADAYTGTTIGASKTDNFTAVTTTKVRLNILNCSTAAPSIYEFEVYGYLKSAAVASTPVSITGLSVFPNPVVESAQVSYGLQTEGNVNITVFDLFGKKVATLVNGSLDAGAYNTMLDASGLTNGTYIVRLTSGSEIKTVKILINK